ncbi:arabinanase/levansucrase/invertase [Wolffia australiana]
MERSACCSRPIKPAAPTRRLLPSVPPHRALLRRGPPSPTPARLPLRLETRPPRVSANPTAAGCLGRRDDVAAAAPPFCPPSEGRVLELGTAGEWDAVEIGSPIVCRFLGDEQERWLIWYHGRGPTGGDGIGLATSANGIHWSRQGLVLGQSGDWWAFDTGGLRPGQVLSMSSAKVISPGAFYWLYYEGHAEQNPQQARPGLAIGQDGRNWARIEGEHPTGALLDPGEPGEWDSATVAAPRVVLHGPGDLRMYYHSSEPPRIGVARSGDGIKWEKVGKVLGPGPAGGFDEGGTMRGHAVQDGRRGGYVMAYEGVAADGRRSIGLAESPDGLTGWRRRGGGPVLGPSEEGGWDEGGVGSPCLVPMDGDQRWRLYYAGVGKDGRGTGIGMAVADGPDLSSFTRCGGGNAADWV